jgi:hypothetical protein
MASPAQFYTAAYEQILFHRILLRHRFLFVPRASRPEYRTSAVALEDVDVQQSSCWARLNAAQQNAALQKAVQR